MERRDDRANSCKFTHANGAVKPVKVNKLDAPKPTTDGDGDDDGEAGHDDREANDDAPADTTKKP